MLQIVQLGFTPSLNGTASLRFMRYAQRRARIDAKY
jgi:hypothetical protein